MVLLPLWFGADTTAIPKWFELPGLRRSCLISAEAAPRTRRCADPPRIRAGLRPQNWNPATMDRPNMLVRAPHKVLPKKSFAEAQSPTDHDRLRVEHIDQCSDLRAEDLTCIADNRRSHGISGPGGRQHLLAALGFPAESIEACHQGRAGGDFLQGVLINPSAIHARNAKRAAGHSTGRPTGAEIGLTFNHQT